MAKKKELSFEEAVDQLQEITSNIEGNRYGMDEMLVKIKEAAALINDCKAKLNSTNEEVKKILATIADTEQ